MNEKNIMKEVRARGPVTVGILTPRYMVYYKSGITNCGERLLPKVSSTEREEEILIRLRDGIRPVEHLVSIVGWGQTKEGSKYWILQNT